MRSTMLTVALSLSLFAAGCAEEQPAAPSGGGATADAGAEGDEGTITIAGQEATNHGSEDVSGATEAEVEIGDFFFAPTVLEGEAGQTVTISLSNGGVVAHTFTIESLGVDVQLGGGETGEAEVTFPESGALPYVCTFHVSGGMLGGLSVGGDLEAASGVSGQGDSGGGGGGGGGSPSGPGY